MTTFLAWLIANIKTPFYILMIIIYEILLWTGTIPCDNILKYSYLGVVALLAVGAFGGGLPVNSIWGNIYNILAAVALGKEVEEKKVVVKVKCGDGGRIFGTVSTKEIAEETKKQTGLDLDKKKMQLSDPIKALGTYEIPVKLHPKVTAKLSVQVVEG